MQVEHSESEPESLEYQASCCVKESVALQEEADKLSHGANVQQDDNQILTVKCNMSNAFYAQYADCCRRLLRTEERCILCGSGKSIITACRTVEMLKEQSVATVTKVSTLFDAPSSNGNKGTSWQKLTATITFELARGERALFVVDHTLRRVVRIFEWADKERSGYLTITCVESLRLADKFFAGAQQCAAATALLAQLRCDKVNISNFIKYANALIHPQVFVDQLEMVAER